MKTLIYIGILFILAAFTNQALAQIEVKTVAEIEVTETDKQGKKIVKRTAPTTVVPGTEVIYTITAKNTGAEAADNIVVTNPVPEHTVYIDGSAFGTGTNITFSVDGGKSFDQGKKLTVKDAKGKARPAKADDYTHVRWTFQFSLQPGQEAPVWYRTRVK
jgi:uncharacterized repeat protein (TIGR01451 family)